MADVPKFILFGDNDPEIQKSLQPTLKLREWSELKSSEKEIIYQQLVNDGWVRLGAGGIALTIEYLNHHYLMLCPGKYLHKCPPVRDRYGNMNVDDRQFAANKDFREILLSAPSALVLVMLSKYAECHISHHLCDLAKREVNESKRQKLIGDAYENFDPFANCLNHIFEQFFINIIATRTGFIPRQDEKITKNIYKPVMQILSVPKWQTVNDALSDMFNDYNERNFPETITKAHSVIQRFLQIVVEGEEGKNGKGEVGKLFNAAKERGLIPVDRFSEPIINVFQSFIVSERATNSTAKPAMKETTSSAALLVMNVVMVFLQHCLQCEKSSP